METLLEEIKAERIRQDEKWGEQNHTPVEWVSILTEEVGEVAKEALDEHFGNVSDGSCMERYRIELIQVAAVAVAMVECLDRNKQNK